jgi:hypothetical protein
MKRTPELFRTDLTHPQTSTSGTWDVGPQALSSATVLMSFWHSPGTLTAYGLIWGHGFPNLGTLDARNALIVIDDESVGCSKI